MLLRTVFRHPGNAGLRAGRNNPHNDGAGMGSGDGVGARCGGVRWARERDRGAAWGWAVSASAGCGNGIGWRRGGALWRRPPGARTGSGGGAGSHRVDVRGARERDRAAAWGRAVVASAGCGNGIGTRRRVALCRYPPRPGAAGHGVCSPGVRDRGCAVGGFARSGGRVPCGARGAGEVVGVPCGDLAAPCRFRGTRLTRSAESGGSPPCRSGGGPAWRVRGCRRGGR